METNTKYLEIISVILSLENKIENNKTINKNLEEQMQIIFKLYFIDFEPFKNCEFENSELGKIPKGWKIIFFKDLLTIRNEKTIDSTIPEFSVTNAGIFPRDSKFNKKLSSLKTKNKIAYKNDLVFGMSREILNWGIMKDSIGSVSSAYNVFAVNPIINSLYLELFIKNKFAYFSDIIKPAAREGQGIDKSVLFAKGIYLPPEIFR